MKKNNFHIKPLSLVILTALVCLVFAIFYFSRKERPKYVQPRRGVISEAVYGLGKVKTHREYEVKVGVSTKIEKAYVDEGDFVQAGSPLISFKDLPAVKAPFAGTVTKLDRQAPEIVFPNEQVLTLANLKDRYIEVSLEQEGALRVRPGQEAKVLFESLRNLVYVGKVKSIYPKEDEFLVQIVIPSLSENILPGMTADVTIEVFQHNNALLIPLSSLSNGLAIAKREGKKIKIAVKIGSVDGKWAQVLEGDVRMSDKFLARSGKR